MSKIQVGDRVTCIDDSNYTTNHAVPVNLKKGREYIVAAISKNCCGKSVVDVSLPDDMLTSAAKSWICHICRHEDTTRIKTAWRLMSRFIRREENTQQEKTEAVCAIKLTEQLVLSEN